MGLWDSIKKAASSAKCGMGFHGGDFKKIEGKTCDYEKTCPDCNAYVKTKRHKMTAPEYKSEYSCVKVRHCSLCDFEEEKIHHQRYEVIATDDYCNNKNQCIRCGDITISGHTHHWTSDGESETHYFQRCIRCGVKRSDRKTNFKR